MKTRQSTCGPGTGSSRWRLRPVLGIGLLILSATPAAHADDARRLQQQQATLERIRNRLLDEWTLRTLPPDSAAVKSQLGQVTWKARRALQATDYGAQWDDVALPAISAHAGAFGELRALAVAYAMPASPYHREPQLLGRIDAGLRALQQFVYAGCDQPHNWWTWQIGMPLHLIPTLILLEDDLDPKLSAHYRAAVAYLLKLADADRAPGVFEPPDERPVGETDMNTLWHCRLRLQFGVLTGNPRLAGAWAVKAFGEVGPPGAGHLQADGSYHFHGPIPMWAYGRAFVIDYAKLLSRYTGTVFAPSAAERQRYAHLAQTFVDGFLYRGRLAPSMIGREITRGPQHHETFYAAAALGIVAACDPARQEQFAALYARERALLPDVHRFSAWEARFRPHIPRVPPAPPVDAVFAYPDSDYLQITRPTWSVGIKLHSSRTRPYESINGENLRGWFLSHGSLFPLLSGSEWDGVWPTLDWTRLMGTTVAAAEQGRNTSPLAGVLAVDGRGLAAVELASDEFRARKSWHVAADVIWCLGSGIRGPAPVETVVVNQAVRGEQVLLADGKPLTPPFDLRRRVRTLHLGRIGYVFARPTRLRLIGETRTGRWREVRRSDRPDDDRPLEQAYATVVVEHDEQTDVYAYAMVLDVEAAELPGVVARLATVALTASDKVHAVRGNQAAPSVVFFEAGGVDQVRADGPALVLPDGDAATYHIVDPTWAAESRTLTVGQELLRVQPARGRPVSARVAD